MSTTPTPVPADLLAQLQKGMDLKLNVTATLPGEALIVALINYATEVRKNMDTEMIKRLDTVTVQQIEDLQHVWRGLWKLVGVVQ